MKTFLVKCLITADGKDLVNYINTICAKSAIDALEKVFFGDNIPDPPQNVDSFELTLSIKPS